MSTFKTIELLNNQKLKIIDQTKLPLAEEYIVTDNYERIAVSIERLEVRGAPAIGITAAYALALSFKNTVDNYESRFSTVYDRLASTRPTAVNLFWALEEMKKVFEANKNRETLFAELLGTAIKIHEDDNKMSRAMAENGLPIFVKKSRVLTHCNTGSLAAGGFGTAFGIIKNAYEHNLVEFVHADETRPLLQGSRLTAFELEKAGVPFAINTDSTAAFLMQQNKVDLVIVGSDRIAVNGDAANKIGTYSLAVLCNYHKIPFYIAAPTTTIDKSCKTGRDIKIEFRNKSEVSQIKNVAVTKDDYEVFSPAFDVTPNKLITAIITEKGLHKPPYNFSDV